MSDVKSGKTSDAKLTGGLTMDLIQQARHIDAALQTLAEIIYGDGLRMAQHRRGKAALEALGITEARPVPDAQREPS